jgi:hypothetical protein
MSTEVKPNLSLEIGHVLFIDDQREMQQQLNQIARDADMNL